MEHDVLPGCKERFDKIDRRLEDGDRIFDSHGERIVGVEHDVSHLTKSLDGVTKALWGVATAIGMSLIGFLIWFVENRR